MHDTIIEPVLEMMIHDMLSWHHLPFAALCGRSWPSNLSFMAKKSAPVKRTLRVHESSLFSVVVTSYPGTVRLSAADRCSIHAIAASKNAFSPSSSRRMVAGIAFSLSSVLSALHGRQLHSSSLSFALLARLLPVSLFAGAVMRVVSSIVFFISVILSVSLSYRFLSVSFSLLSLWHFCWVLPSTSRTCSSDCYKKKGG